VERQYGGGGVQQLELCTAEERLQAGARRKEVVVISQDKFFECGWSQAAGSASVPVSVLCSVVSTLLRRTGL
jgi:hypothetical protein